MSQVDFRVRRPSAHEMLLARMRDDGGFPTMRDALLFAAALGMSLERRAPFESAGEPIRYETMFEPAFASTLINMMSAITHEQDAEILDGDRLPERILVFEEYANGGLEYLQELLNTRRQALDVLVQSLVVESLADTKGRDAASVTDLLQAVDW